MLEDRETILNAFFDRKFKDSTPITFHYDPETDSLYIDLADRVSSDLREVSPGVVLDFDSAGTLVGIDIEHASERVDLTKVDTRSMPFKAVA